MVIQIQVVMELYSKNINMTLVVLITVGLVITELLLMHQELILFMEILILYSRQLSKCICRCTDHVLVWFHYLQILGKNVHCTFKHPFEMQRQLCVMPFQTDMKTHKVKNRRKLAIIATMRQTSCLSQRNKKKCSCSAQHGRTFP